MRLRPLLVSALLVWSWLPSSTAASDPRSQVLLASDCRTEVARREVTLFANGTLRIRTGRGATREMRLAELGRSELEAYVARLREIEFDDLASSSPGLEGDWVEDCLLVLELPGEERRRFEYGPYDSIPLGWKHVLLIVDDLLEELETSRRADDRVRDYDPLPGDILVRRSDGARYEVLGRTLEGSGVELQGLDEPMTVFILLDHLLEQFEPAEEVGADDVETDGGW